jgi:hypothetical protein
MTLFEESRWQASERLPGEYLVYYRDVLTIHANDPVRGECRICRRPGCPDWRNAYDQLAFSGELMAKPDHWCNRLTGSGVRR